VPCDTASLQFASDIITIYVQLQILQNAAIVITKYVIYYKMRKLLQNVGEQAPSAESNGWLWGQEWPRSRTWLTLDLRHTHKNILLRHRKVIYWVDNSLALFMYQKWWRTKN